MRNGFLRPICLITVGLAYTFSCATIVLQVNRAEAVAVPHWISHADGPVDIRVQKIVDDRLINAIGNASKQVQVLVLVDEVTPELMRLAPRLGKSLQVRVAAPYLQGHGFEPAIWDLEVGEPIPIYDRFLSWVNVGKYMSWVGPGIWERSRFRPATSFTIESGGIIWERSPRFLDAFRRMFAQGIRLQSYL